MLEIEEAKKLRESLKISPVKLHEVPGWFRRRVLKRFGTAGGNPNGMESLARVEEMVPSLSKWLDHWGTTIREDGTVAFVSEPYLEASAAEPLVAELAGELGCNWLVSETSWWYPTSTIRAMLFEGPGSLPLDKIERKQTSK